MPLFQVTGVTNVKSIFNAAFGIINNECEDGFTWLASQLNALQVCLGIPPPNVFITDFEKTLKSALRTIFPYSAQQICIFHANKNVVLNIKQKWRDPMNPSGIHPGDQAVAPPMLAEEDDHQIQALNALASHSRPVHHISADEVEYSQAGIYLLWKHMVYAKTEEDYGYAWDLLKMEFRNQTAILGYLEDHYIPWINEIAHPFISQNQNFGQRTTSPTESAIRDVKSNLVNGNSTLLKPVQILQLMLENKKKAFEDTITTQKAQMQHQGQQEWLGTTAQEVSYKAVDLMIQQKRIALEALPSLLGFVFKSCYFGDKKAKGH